MTRFKRVLVIFTTLASLVSAIPRTGPPTHDTCTKKLQRKAWQNLSDAEKKAYIDAELCLMNTPSKLDIEGAQNLWDDLHYIHIIQSNIIHFTGSFLPWHRYFVHLHEYLLRTECNYAGAQPYWEQFLDIGKLNESIIWDPETGFGGQGGKCVDDGPFANLTLHMTASGGVGDYCLSRQFNETAFAACDPDSINECMVKANYSTAWDCWAQGPHGGGHGAVGGVMLDATASPGDPVFFLHHANLDRYWWIWQQKNMPSRLYEMGGQNVPAPFYLALANWTFPTAAWLDYDGDPANVTTLNHNLWMLGLIPNTTVGEVMELGGNLICAEYI